MTTTNHKGINKGWEKEFERKFCYHDNGVLEFDHDFWGQASKVKTFISNLLSSQKEQIIKEIEGMKKEAVVWDLDDVISKLKQK